MNFLKLFLTVSQLSLFALPYFAVADVVADYISGAGAAAARPERQLGLFPEVLDENQLKSCLKFLSSRPDEESFKTDIVRQNDLADWMLQKGAYAKAVTETMIAVISDNDQSILWREYSLQKLPLAFHQSDALPSELRKKCVNILVNYKEDDRGSFAGTALLGLYRIHRETDSAAESPVDSEALREAAYRVFSSKGGTSANRITALHVGIHLGDRRVISQALRTIHDENANPHLRSAAISATLKHFDSEDLAYIENLLSHPDYRIREAAKTVVASLKTP